MRDLLIQIKVDKEEKQIFEMMAALKRETVSDYVRNMVEGEYQNTDWYDIGYADGQENSWTPPRYARPGEKEYDDWEAGFREGQ